MLLDKKMINLNKLKCIKDEHGALSIEFAMTFLGVILVLFLVYDFYVAMALQGKLDRSTYSAATAFRERTYFYRGGGGNVEAIDQAQVEQLEDLLSGLMGLNSVEIKVEALYITGSSSNPSDIGMATKEVVGFCGVSGCSSSYFSSLPDFDSLYNLAAYSQLNRWVPLYRISACVANSESLFKRAVNGLGVGDGINELCTSSVVVSRCSGNCETPTSITPPAIPLPLP
ncbi:tight adherence pilus pseudopilin TadF [Zophobihabitans entericus]|uniref:Uncharacterized protein n=1 Tax=Zophobihabitans entericus TaxID=1635327 RepID=A0A6G9IBV1_9GAMM|nr:tight adherence pilus pseudopilin TadF [Zophobihabitans entericus]QIQ21312.1 hypothetical protein IPMB12_06200 [Zophobihabitans entericus]